jgi:hypothetical protein
LKINKFFLGALLVTVLGCGYVYFFTGAKKVSSPSPVMSSLDASAVLARTKTRAGTRESPFRSKPVVMWDIDPFELPPALGRSHVEAGRIPMKVVAILSGRDGRVAIIGSEVVKTGDLVNGERVTEIGPRGVVFGQGDSKRYLMLEDKGGQVVPGNANVEVGK